MGKVWVIDDGSVRRGSESATNGSPPGDGSAVRPGGPAAAGSALPGLSGRRAGERSAASSYGYAPLPSWAEPGIFGPFAAALRCRGRRRGAWIGVGIAPLLATLLLLPASPLSARVGTVPFGVATWVLVATVCFVALAVVWAAGALAAARRPAKSSERGFGIGDVAGLLVPGFALRRAGRPGLAVLVQALVGLGLGGAILAARAGWLWEAARSGVLPGMTAPGLEGVFLGSAVVALTGAVVWLVQSLDGLRRLAPGPSPRITDLTGAALLAALGLFAFTFRPAPFAASLHETSVTLGARGLRVIPLLLSESARQLDPDRPVYAAETAELLESLGQQDAAYERRRSIERRMREYVEVVGRDKVLVPAPREPVAYGPTGPDGTLAEWGPGPGPWAPSRLSASRPVGN